MEFWYHCVKFVYRLSVSCLKSRSFSKSNKNKNVNESILWKVFSLFIYRNTFNCFDAATLLKKNAFFTGCFSLSFTFLHAEI